MISFRTPDAPRRHAFSPRHAAVFRRNAAAAPPNYARFIAAMIIFFAAFIRCWLSFSPFLLSEIDAATPIFFA
jgi:hypothetical protein